MLSDPFVWEEHEVYAQVSIGIAVFPDDGENAELLVRNADTAMYHAKDLGRDNFQFYGQFMNLAAQRHLHLSSELRHALERHELSLHYQPIRDAVSGELTALEALLRWNHPGDGFVPPDEFIPVAEETGLIRPLGDWALRAACVQGRAWQSAGFRAIRIAVNVSARQLQKPNWADEVARILAETGQSAAHLELELTESAIMQSDDATVENLSRLSEMGVGLCLDDFGTGYSSLSYLSRFPIDRVKIDRSFVSRLSDDSGHTSLLVEAILSMAKCLNLGVVAEGVETEEQLQFLRERGCHEIQGFLVNSPATAEELLPLFRTEKEEASEDERPTN
jgi:EAL domain-containing protein (putative c-di-GMP-specific phosphodiesterase class I)